MISHISRISTQIALIPTLIPRIPIPIPCILITFILLIPLPNSTFQLYI